MAALSPIQNQFAQLADTLSALSAPKVPEKLGIAPFAGDLFGLGPTGGDAASFMGSAAPPKLGFAGGLSGAVDNVFGGGIAKLGYQSRSIGASQVGSNLAGSGNLGALGQLSNAGGGFAKSDQFNQQIAAAAQRWGAPPNLVKAILTHESSGDWEANHWVNNLRGEEMLPFSGIFRSTADSWGVDFEAMKNNPGLQIDAIAKGLSILAKDYGGFENAAKVYFGGPQALTPGGFTDERGENSNSYGADILSWWHQLDQQAGSSSTTGATGSFSGSSGALGSMFQSSAVPDWGEFNAPSSNGLYGYGTQYGLNGVNHTGLDIPMPVGSAYRAPMGGVVTCAGTGNGSGADGGGCAAFGDSFGNGAGRVEVLLDNGAVLIFGHSSTAALAPGTRFNAGTVLGTSGGENSPHVHLEARIRDSSTPSGWRIVDPRSVLGGGSFGGSSGGFNWSSGSGSSSQFDSPGAEFAYFLRGGHR